MNSNSTSAFLLLADGTLFEGKSFGAIGTTSGEICFNTGMTGYQEVFTDPSYYKQILIMNAAHIGNYGVKPTDVESDTVKIAGLISKNLSDTYSRVQATGTLQSYLEQNGIVSIHGVDTRALVSHIRSEGAMNCLISSDGKKLDELKAILAQVPSMEGLALAESVSTKVTYELGDSNSKKRIAVLDCGVKQHILSCMTERGAFLKVFPVTTPTTEILEYNADAHFISNGPGDPSAMPDTIKTVSELIETGKPMFGICLGHQLIALASGAKTYKMHHGHRGLNHPVMNLETGISEISTQNHGFAVDKASVDAIDKLEITHINLNDNTLEGIKRTDKPVFAVQYHPEATPGPHDSRYLFDKFVAMI